MIKAGLLHPRSGREIERLMREVIASIRAELAAGRVPRAEELPEKDQLSQLLKHSAEIAEELKQAPRELNQSSAFAADSAYRTASAEEDAWELGTRKLLRRAYAIADDAYVQAQEAHRCFLEAKEHRDEGDADRAVSLMARGAMLLATAISTFYLAPRRRGARIKQSRSGLESAKRDAKTLWEERRTGKHPKLRTNEQFAMECMKRWPALTSISTILGWCTTWNKEARGGRTPTC